MSKFKAEFTLKQHTPIIHFQSEQSGATLKATELKPKFDRFLLENVKDIPFVKNANGHKSIDYKVKIEQNISSSQNIDARNPLFFGNMGDGEDKKFKLNNNSFKIIFFTFNQDIKKIIEENFESFLANSNFGTRQSKGFGSFYLTNKKFDISLIKYKVYSFKTKNWQKDVALLYQFLRQGVNLPNKEGTRFYSKPAIFAYAKSKGWQWDKKAIKQEYFNEKLQNQIEEHNSDILVYSAEKKYILRDLFGLSSSQQWKSYGKTVEKTGIRVEFINNREVIAIQRFKSPITFKVIDNQVYFWANDSVNKILGEEFQIKAGYGNDNLELSTPEEFDFNDFFDFSFNKINLSTHIESKYHKQNEFKTLSKIFKDIKASL